MVRPDLPRSALKCAGLEQSEHQAVADLEEDDLARDVERRGPAEAADVERARGIEISGGEGDEAGCLIHASSVPSQPLAVAEVFAPRWTVAVAMAFCRCRPSVSSSRSQISLGVG